MDATLQWLCLSRTPMSKRVLFNALRSIDFSLDEFFSLSRAECLALGLNEKTYGFMQAPPLPELEKDLAWFDAHQDAHIVPMTHSAYPQLLKTLDDPPLVLFVKGQPECLNNPQIAMVGSRNATAGGINNAKTFAHYFSSKGLTVTSGLALGIDTASHQGALEAKGATIAVMATGLDRIYPHRNRALAAHICEQGALVTEFACRTEPKRYHFPLRNRLISGLSLTTLVVEATPKSGSLITAKHALEQNRDAMAIPGSIHNPVARGCHALIKQGAKLIETADDVLEELPEHIRQTLKPVSDNPQSLLHLREVVKNKPVLSTTKSALQQSMHGQDYVDLMQALGFDPTSPEMLAKRCGLTIATVCSMLLTLELDGAVEARPGGLYMCT